jgi:hypothetical protein
MEGVVSIELREMYLLSTISIYRPDVWIWTNNAIKQRDALCVIGFFVKLQVHDILNKLSKRLRTNATERFWRGRHLFLADEKTFVVSLN